jgi:hypothetical protein
VTKLSNQKWITVTKLTTFYQKNSSCVLKEFFRKKLFYAKKVTKLSDLTIRYHFGRLLAVAIPVYRGKLQPEETKKEILPVLRIRNPAAF